MQCKPIVCPLCGKEKAFEWSHHKAPVSVPQSPFFFLGFEPGVVEYVCFGCGYTLLTNFDGRWVFGPPRKMLRFVKWARRPGGTAEKYPWWPAEVSKFELRRPSYHFRRVSRIMPVVVGGRLRWRRWDAEPRGRSVRMSKDFTDYLTYREASLATKEGHLARRVRGRTRFRILHRQ